MSSSFSADWFIDAAPEGHRPPRPILMKNGPPFEDVSQRVHRNAEVLGKFTQEFRF